jgi:hypothetical protein
MCCSSRRRVSIRGRISANGDVNAVDQLLRVNSGIDPKENRRAAHTLFIPAALSWATRLPTARVRYSDRVVQVYCARGLHESVRKLGRPSGVCVIAVLSPHRGCVVSHFSPTACAVGCILTPLRGSTMTYLAHSFQRHLGGWPTLGDRGCPTLALFARVGIRDLSALGMLVVGICDFPPIEMHDGWGSLNLELGREKPEARVGQPPEAAPFQDRFILTHYRGCRLG